MLKRQLITLGPVDWGLYCPGQGDPSEGSACREGTGPTGICRVHFSVSGVEDGWRWKWDKWTGWRIFCK